MAQSRNIVLIGATGSIGENTLEVLRAHPGELRLLGIAASNNEAALKAIQEEFEVPHACLFSSDGIEGLNQITTLPEADVVLVASTGTASLGPTLAAIKAKKTIALANKEIMVLAGELIMKEAAAAGVDILPVDSEHNAIFQCLEGFRCQEDVEKVILTASGGPFRNYSREEMINVSAEEALKHPNWNMGPKVTLDSATLANKGLEVMEARWLFQLAPSQIDVLVHPQSIVHSMVQGIDGSVIAQLSPPSMTYPIQHTLFYPQRRRATKRPGPFLENNSLEFYPPDLDAFPCLRLAMEVIQTGGTAPAIYNVANEIAGECFLQNRIPFLAIPKLIEQCLENSTIRHPDTLEGFLEAEDEARNQAREFSRECSL